MVATSTTSCLLLQIISTPSNSATPQNKCNSLQHCSLAKHLHGGDHCPKFKAMFQERSTNLCTCFRMPSLMLITSTNCATNLTNSVKLSLYHHTSLHSAMYCCNLVLTNPLTMCCCTNSKSVCNAMYNFRSRCKTHNRWIMPSCLLSEPPTSSTMLIQIPNVPCNLQHPLLYQWNLEISNPKASNLQINPKRILFAIIAKRKGTTKVSVMPSNATHNIPTPPHPTPTKIDPIATAITNGTSMCSPRSIKWSTHLMINQKTEARAAAERTTYW